MSLSRSWTWPSPYTSRPRRMVTSLTRTSPGRSQRSSFSNFAAYPKSYFRYLFLLFFSTISKHDCLLYLFGVFICLIRSHTHWHYYCLAWSTSTSSTRSFENLGSCKGQIHGNGALGCLFNKMGLLGFSTQIRRIGSGYGAAQVIQLSSCLFFLRLIRLYRRQEFRTQISQS